MADTANQVFAAIPWPTSTPSFSNHTVDASGDAIGLGFQARDTEAITHIYFRYGARAGTPPTFILTLEGVDATTGTPDGTDVGGGSPTAVTFTPPADATWDGTLQAVALTNAYTPTRGQVLVATIRYSSGTIDGSNNSTFTTDITSLASAIWLFPIGYRLTGGVWAKRQTPPVVGVRTANRRYGLPVESLFSTRSASTVGHRQALKFTLPNICDTFTLKGVRIAASLAAAAAAKNPVLGLWSAAGVIQNLTLDSDWSVNAVTAHCLYTFYFDESSLTTLTPGTAYYIGLEVADAVNGGVLLNGLQLDSSADLDAYSGGGNFHFATFDGTNWTDDATVRPFVELLLGDITEPAGGGGVFMPRPFQVGV